MAPNHPCIFQIRTWGDFLDRYHWHSTNTDAGNLVQPNWIFRGQRRASWLLCPSLERSSAEQYNLCVTGDALAQAGTSRYFLSDSTWKAALEEFLLRKFKRECDRFGLSSIPAKKDDLGWLAWMQHYGAPTRLLDFTYSMFVALFFAIDDPCGDRNEVAAVWAVNDQALGPGLSRAIQEQGTVAACQAFECDRALTRKRTFRQLFRANPPMKLVGSVNSFTRHERMVIQQGVFLCPGDVRTSFMENLNVVLGNCDASSNPLVIRYEITENPAVRREMLRHLMRMNISRATLFPGLDGFAESLRQWLAFPEIIYEGWMTNGQKG